MKRYVNQAVLVILLLLWSVMPALGKEASLTDAEVRDGWILLFDGESMFGWSPEGQLNWRASDGVLSADGSGAGYIRTTSAFSDFVLKMEIRVAGPTADAALYVRTAKDGFPTDNGYQIRLGDSNPSWPAGSIVPRFKADPAHPQPGQWHSFEVDADGDHITVLIDQKSVADGKDSSARGGYIGFKVAPGTKLEVRNIKLKLLDTIALFNGSDLTGWKIVTPPPPSEKPGKLKKLFPFGGGKPKIKESAWSVQSGVVYGDKGPGQLETATPYDDFVLQFAVPTSTKKQPGHRTVYVRGDPGKLFTGYEIMMDADRPGAIGPNLKSPRRIVPIKDLAIGTVAATGRYLEVWINGFPVTEFTDTRPEGATTVQNARTLAGAIGLPLHNSSAVAEYSLIRLTTAPKTLGGIVGKPPPAPAPQPPTPATIATPAVSTPTILESPEAKQAAENHKEEARLMQEVLATNDPEKQKELYTRILTLNPGNSNAMQGLKEAQAKLEKQVETRAQTTESETASNDAFHKAEAAFLIGNLSTADSQLAIAERLAPNNAAIRELRQKIDSARAQNSRLRYLLFGGGFLAFGGLSTLFFIRLRKRHGFLQVVSGMDNGRRYNLDQDVIRIGAVAQDGGEKNDIVVRDMEHMVSRFHCMIHNSNGKFYLEDCNSANGTRIDKRLVPPGEPKRLKSGARVDLAGTVTMRFGLERRRKSKAS